MRHWVRGDVRVGCCTTYSVRVRYSLTVICWAAGKPLKQWQLEEAMTAMGTDISGWVDLDAFAHWWDMSHTEEAVNHNVRARMTRADDVALAERTRMEHCIKDEQQFQDHLGQLESQLATVRQVFRGRMAALKEDFSAVR